MTTGKEEFNDVPIGTVQLQIVKKERENVVTGQLAKEWREQRLFYQMAQVQISLVTLWFLTWSVDCMAISGGHTQPVSV